MSVVSEVEDTLKQPFTTNIPMWQFALVFVLFVCLAWIVVDNLNILKKGLSHVG